MSTSPRRPAFDPLITRQYDPSRIQKESLVAAYYQLIPISSRRLGSPRSRPGECGRAEVRVGKSRPSAAGA